MKKSRFLSYGYLIVVIVIARNTTEAQTCLEPFCYCPDPTTLRCANFTRFEDLNFGRTSNRVFTAVELRPNGIQLDINERLSFYGLRLNGRLSISNIRSFSAFYNPFRQIVYDRFDLAFFNSYFSFVGAVGATGNQHSEQAILDSCELTEAAVNYDYVFSDLALNEFVLCNVYFERKICPIVFRNTFVKNMIINDPIGAYGYTPLKIPTNNDDIIYTLNTNINQIDFTYSVDNQIQPQWLDADYIIYPEMFARTERVNLNSARRLAYIKEDTFKRLSGVRKFEINNVPLKHLLGYNRNWLRNLNYHMIPLDLDYVSLNQSISRNVFQLIIWVNDEWNFNDEKDICLFKHFPHQRLVFPFLMFSKPTLPCTCTIYWLYKYFSRYQTLFNLNQDVVPFHCFQNSYNWDKCHFETLFYKYCPDDPEIIEAYTTLKPSIDFIGSTPSCCTSSTTTTTTTAIYTYPSITTQSSSPYETVTTQPYLTSSHSQLFDLANCRFSAIAFWLAIFLSILAAFIIAALIVLYYKVWRKRRAAKLAAAAGDLTVCETDNSMASPPSPPLNLVVTDLLVIDTSITTTTCGAGFGEVTVSACNGTCAACKTAIYI